MSDKIAPAFRLGSTKQNVLGALAPQLNKE